jgi:hypothetical protein
MTNTSPTTAVTTTKNKAGRPRAHVDLAQVTELAAQGYSMNDIARKLGVSERLMWQRCAEDPSVKSAYDIGVDDPFGLATKTLRELILERNLGAICFLLRNKFKWTAGSTSEVTIKHEVQMPTIDGHVLEMAAYQSALLDSPDPDAVDAEFSEVGEFDLVEACK